MAGTLSLTRPRLFRSLCYLVPQVAGFMIAAELAQRSFVELKKNLAQCLGFRMPGGETLPINLTQRVDGRVTVFVADFTVVVAVAIVETCAAHHGALHCAYSSESILLPRSNGNLAPQPGPAGRSRSNSGDGLIRSCDGKCRSAWVD